MDVHKSSLLAVFDAKQRLEVPLFQRQYVWKGEEQWLPLWEDIERKFTEALEGRKDAPNHFLGAMVLDQKQTPTGHVVVRQVIDGQQRLTTLQIFLAAYRDFCKTQQCDALAAECDKFLFNTGLMANPDVDRFKVWPTQLDRPQFTDVVASGSREELLKRHPLRRRPYARKPDPRPRRVEAYLFFFDQLEGFFLGDEGNPPLGAEHPVSARMDECLVREIERRTFDEEFVLKIPGLDLFRGENVKAEFVHPLYLTSIKPVFAVSFAKRPIVRFAYELKNIKEYVAVTINTENGEALCQTGSCPIADWRGCAADLVSHANKIRPLQNIFREVAHCQRFATWLAPIICARNYWLASLKVLLESTRERRAYFIIRGRIRGSSAQESLGWQPFESYLEHWPDINFDVEKTECYIDWENNTIYYKGDVW